MSRQEIAIEISSEGDVSVEAVGFEGKSCTEATKDIEEALGTVEDRRFKSEHRQTSSRVRNQMRIGEK